MSRCSLLFSFHICFHLGLLKGERQAIFSFVFPGPSTAPHTPSCPIVLITWENESQQSWYLEASVGMGAVWDQGTQHRGWLAQRAAVQEMLENQVHWGSDSKTLVKGQRSKEDPMCWWVVGEGRKLTRGAFRQWLMHKEEGTS